MSMATLKQEFDEKVSQLVREYEESGLEPHEICDSLLWHSELAQSRHDESCSDGRERVLADD